MFDHSGDSPVYYEIRGEGRPVLCLHGYPVDHHCMYGALEPLFQNRSGYKRIYIDLPGMGLSPPSESIRSADDMIERIHFLIESLIPGEPYLVAAYSYGGYLARGMVYKYADEIGGLFLFCPVSLPDRKDRDLPPHRVFSRDESFIATLGDEEAAEFGKMAVIQNEEIYMRYAREIREPLTRGDREFIRRYVREGYGFSFPVDKIPPFEKPVQILAGRQDSVVGYRDMQIFLENFPRAGFIVLDRAGHNLQMEQEKLFCTFLSDWIERIELEE